MRCSFCSREASELITEFELRLCITHVKKFKKFLLIKNDAKTSIVEEMRVIERLVKDNSGIVICPSCGSSSMEVHHWEKEGSKERVPVFKCKTCDFKG